MGFFVRLAITAFGLWLADYVVDGITIADNRTLVLAAFLLGLVNAFVRPLAIFFTLPLTLVTLGLFLWVINAAMLGLTAAFLEGFRIDGLLPAMLGSLLVGFTGWVASWYVGPKGRVEVMVVRR